MPFETDLPSIGRDFKSERDGWGKDIDVISYVWLAFYVLAVTSSLLSQSPPATVATANTPIALLPAPSH